MSNGPSTSPVILIAEDELVIGLDLEGLLQDEGYDTVGPCESVADALEVLDHRAVDAALLDLELKDGDSFPVARRLRQMNTPFVFCSGRPERIGDEFSDCAKLAKPCQPVELRQTLSALLGHPTR